MGGPIPRQVAKKADEQAKKPCTSMMTASVPASRLQDLVLLWLLWMIDCDMEA